MEDTAKYREIECPSCGAPIQAAGLLTKCPYCGSVLERVEPPEEKVVSIEIPFPPTAVPAARPRRAGCVLLIAGIAVALVGGLVAWLLSAPSDSPIGPIINLSPRIVQEAPILVPSDREGPADVLVLNYRPNEEIYNLTYLDGANRTTVWDSPAISRGVAEQIIVDRTLIFAVDEDNLLALSRTDGTIAWQSTLADTIHPSCQQCLQVFGDHVVALTTDGTLQSYEKSTGRPAWSKRLNGTPYQLINVRNRPAVLDIDAPERWDNIDLYIWDPVDGSLVQRITPLCGEGHFAENIERDSPVLVSPTGQEVYLLYGLSPACAQEWDLASGELVWQTTADTYFHNPNAPPILVEGTIYIAYGGQVWAVDTADGALRQLTDESDYELSPALAQDGILVVKARRTRGSTRHELWGLDEATGEQRWQHITKDEEPIEEAGSWASNTWDIRLTQRGLVLVHLFREPEPPHIVVETLDLQSGTSGGQVVNPIENYLWDGIAWTDDTFWVVSRKLYVVDLVSGKLLYSWP